MKFTCRTEHLKNALGMLSRVVPTKPVKDILKAIKFSCVEGICTIQGNDGENALAMRIPITNLDAGGAGLLEFSKLRPIVESFTEGETTIELGDTTARILSGLSKFTLGCGRTDEYPAFPTNDGQTKLQMNSGEWSAAIARLEPFSVPPAASAWRGVYIESSDAHGVCAASCDGNMFGWEILDAKVSGPDVKALLSERGSKLIAAVLYGIPGDCVIQFSEALVSIDTPSGTAICRLNEGKFPDWRKVRDKWKMKHESVFPRDSMLTALNQATIPLTDSSRRLRFRFTDNNLTLSANVAGDESEVQLPFAWSDEEMEFVYSGDMIKRVVAAFPAEAQIKVFLKDDGDPIRMESGSIGFQVSGMERENA